jgi:hypothetical protein
MRRNLPLPLLCQSNSTLSLSQVPIVQVVERVVEILKEVPIEVVKEVPVYVRTDVSDVEQHNRQKGQVTQCVLSTSLSLSLSLLSRRALENSGQFFVALGFRICAKRTRTEEHPTL